LKARLIVAVLIAVASLAASADYDPKLEAQEAAQRKAEAAAAAKRNADADKQKSAAMRKYLGKEADGKSDAEVKRLYDARVNAQLEMAKKAQAGGAPAPGPDAAKGDAQMKSMTGKSMQDIQKMTPAEQEAFARQMEKQYGGAK
jgi:hypothetical protein